jgi:hypothetical protein
MQADLAILLLIAEPANIVFALESQGLGSDFRKALKGIVIHYEIR